MKISDNCIICKNIKLLKRPAILMPFIADRIFEWTPFFLEDKFNLRSIKTGIVYSNVNSCYCKICHLIYLDMRFDKDEVKKLYKDYRGSEYNELRIKYEPEYKEMDNYLNNIYPIENRKKTEKYLNEYLETPSEILDWGGGDGRNTPFFEDKNIKIDIFEISEKEDAKISNILFINKVEKKYELITALHVFEHVPYPLDLLNEINQALKINGYIYIEVPFENIMRNFINPINEKNHWHEHINFYSPLSFEIMLSKLKLKIINISTQDISDNFRDCHIIRVLAQKTYE